MPDEASPLRHRVDLRDPDHLKLATEVGVAWREIRRGSTASVVRDKLYGSGPDALEPGQVDTLDLLNQRAAWRMSDLADALRVDPSTATRAVQRLVKVGLAERRPSDDDGRVVMVATTALGQETFDRLNWRRGRMLAKIIEHFEPDERPLLVETLQRFVSALDNVVETFD